MLRLTAIVIVLNGCKMAKNEAQKIMKSIVYLCCQKGYAIEIYNNKYHKQFESRDPEVIWNNYKKYSSGLLAVKSDVNYVMFNFSIPKNEFDHSVLRTSSTFKKELLQEAEFFRNIYNV